MQTGQMVANPVTAQEVILATAALCLPPAHQQTVPIMARPLTPTGLTCACAPAQKASQPKMSFILVPCRLHVSLQRIAMDMVSLTTWTEQMDVSVRALMISLATSVRFRRLALLWIALAMAIPMTKTEPMVAIVAYVQAATQDKIVLSHHVVKMDLQVCVGWSLDTMVRRLRWWGHVGYSITVMVTMVRMRMQQMTTTMMVIAVVMVSQLTWTKLMVARALALMTTPAPTVPSLRSLAKSWVHMDLHTKHMFLSGVVTVVLLMGLSLPATTRECRMRSSAGKRATGMLCALAMTWGTVPACMATTVPYMPRLQAAFLPVLRSGPMTPQAMLTLLITLMVMKIGSVTSWSRDGELL